MKQYTVCRFCLTVFGDPVINLGKMPLAGGFLTSSKDFDKEKLYPLQLSFCRKCFLLQTTTVITPKTLFKNYFYRSSAIETLAQHFKKTAEEILRLTSFPPRGLVFSKRLARDDAKQALFIVEIGCNDGSFLKSCLDLGFRAVGVDPATNIVEPLIKKGTPIINDYFSEKVAEKIVKNYGYADIIFSANTLAHIEDMHDIFRGIKKLLSKKGKLIFEIHYLGDLLSKLQYDMIYHEHQYYYSLHAIQSLLTMHDMEVFDIKKIPVHAGSLRIYAQHKGAKKNVHQRVNNLLEEEKEKGLLVEETYKKFNRTIKDTKQKLLQLLDGLVKQNKRIVGYGASGRGTIIMNYCGLNSLYLEYVIDDAPVKQGTYTPGTHLQIVSNEILKTKQRPDYVLLFAWSFWKEIQKRNITYIKNGGKFILPLPKVKII